MLQDIENYQDMARLDIAISTAIKEGRSPVEILQLAYEKFPRDDNDNERPWQQMRHAVLCDAVENNHVDLVQTIFNEGYDVNSSRWLTSPFYIACEKRTADIIRIFVKQGADLFKKSTGRVVSYSHLKSPINLILELDRVELLEIMTPLLEKNRIELFSFRTALHLACQHGAVKSTKFLLEKFPKDINSTDVHGNTPLMLAVKEGADIVRLLLEYKARVDVRTSENRRQCLHLLLCVALGTGHAYLPRDTCDVMKLLIEAGADVNAEDIGGETPLSLVCGQIRVEMHQWAQHVRPYSRNVHHQIIKDCIKLLISKGASLNTGSGNLPLNVVLNAVRADIDMYTGRRQTATDSELHRMKETLAFSIELLEYLLQQGADPDLPNVYLQTPLTQMFVHLYSNSYVDSEALSEVWPRVRQVFVLLLRHGARKCELREAFWHKPHNNDVILMVLNSMPHQVYAKQTNDVCSYIRNRPPSQQPSIRSHHEWILDVASTPRSLKQIARVVLYDKLQKTLIESTPKLLLPLIINDYILSFED